MTGRLAIVRIVRRGCVAAAVLLALSACGGGAASDPAVAGVPSASDCAEAASVPLPAPSRPVVVLVADDTRSGPVSADTLPSSVAATLQQAQAAQGELVILAVNGAGANPLFVRTVALDPAPGHTSPIANGARAATIACVPRWITARAAAPTRPGSDILGAVDEAIRRQPSRIIVMSDGLDNVDPLDFNKIGYGVQAGSVVASLNRTDSIDHAAARIPVLWADLGVTAQPLPGVVRDSLKRIWAGILRSAGTTVTFLPDQAPAGKPRAGTPADAVLLPKVTTVIKGCRKTFNVPTDLLFQPGDAHVHGGTAVLDDARNDLVSNPGSTAIVAGNTAAFGSDAYRHSLSVARAQAVARILEADGVRRSRLRIVGYGSGRPAENEFPGGRHDLAAAAANRRVIITVSQDGCG
ncbi:MAG TPA: OmpA family protein [Streptosporangiaceae bacterium]|nr:OmpA family protein [Streptosporangiaceae bacterium]